MSAWRLSLDEKLLALDDDALEVAEDIVRMFDDLDTNGDDQVRECVSLCVWLCG